MSSRSMYLFRRCTLCFLVLFLSLSIELQPTPACAGGELDPGFGTGGVVSINVAGFAPSSLVVDGAGKIVAGGEISGDFGLARFTARGELDASFGTDGIVSTDLGGDEYIYSLVLDAAGNIVAGGEISGDFALARYTARGVLDASFGTDGIVTTDLGPHDSLGKLVLDAAGNIVAGGTAVNGLDRDFILARYTASGDPDASFGTGGIVSTDFGGNERIEALVLDAAGNIVAGAGTGSHFALARYTASGDLDVSFGTDGVVSADLGGNESIYSLVLDGAGNIVAGGCASFNGPNLDFALARYTASGDLDPSFGTDGVVSTDFGGYAIPVCLALDGAGNIVAGGFTGSAQNFDFALARYTASGDLDASFGTDGIVSTDFGGYDRIRSLTIDPVGNIMAAGVSGSSMGVADCIVLARYGEGDFSSGGCDVAALPGAMILLALPLIFMGSRLRK